MCGIVGYIGKRDVAPLLLEGLQRLEYRGYDSAGVVITGKSGELKTVKAKGRVRDRQRGAGPSDRPLAGRDAGEEGQRGPAVGRGHVRHRGAAQGLPGPDR